MKPKPIFTPVIIFTLLALMFSPLGAAPASATNVQPGTLSDAAGLDLPFAYVATQISSGWYHTCALTTNGTIKCWGRNDDGELGNNTWSDSHVWVDVWTASGNSAPLGGIVSIVLGSYHTCALTNAGGVKCWGYNSYGQLGNGSWSSSPTPVDVSGLTSGVVALAAGNSDTCALMASGSVKCWGYNAFGELGNNSTTNSNVPVDVSGLSSGVRAIAAGGYHTCALTAAGSVKCWGYNNLGQLGNNSTVDSHVPVDAWTATGDSTPLSGISALAGGTYHTCALTTAGGVKCWGYNNYGQLGQNSYSSSSVPADVWAAAGDSTPLSGISAITAGESHTCALTTGGGLKCWGSGDQNQIGSSSTTPTPVDVTGLTSGVSAAAAGKYHTCAVTTDGGVRCVGYNAYGELGNNSTTSSASPVDVSKLGSGGAIAIAAGYFDTCAVTSSGGVKCWGRNDYGQLGNNSTTSSSVPVNVCADSTCASSLSGIQAVSTGFYMHTCALTTSGGVKCWGLDASGQLGNGVGGQFHYPVDVRTSFSNAAPLSGVRAIGVGEMFSCALMTSGSVKCWGNNQYGQLGDNSTTTSASPVDVWTSAGNSAPLSNISAISVGDNFACALTTSASVKCWGRNNFGQLGINSATAESHAPVDVVTSASDATPLSGVSTISAGLYHICALMAGGNGKCWGWNFYGQLGDNSTTTRLAPVNATNLTGSVKALVAGSFNTCALTAGSGARCWGWNSSGQVGNNSTTDTQVPVDVIGLMSGVSVISVGFSHTCALTAAGSAKCWGNNGVGSLGNNSTTDSPTYVQVTGLLGSALPIVQLSANPVQAGDSASFAATVSSPVDVLSGTVQFQVDGADFGSPVSISGGSATSPSTTGLAMGVHRITAIYSGDSNYNLSRSASVVQAVMTAYNADLSNLVLSSGTLVPAFASATTVYTASVASVVTSLTVTPTAANTNATITVNGTTVPSGNASTPIALSPGANTITVIVTAQDGVTTKTYTVTVTRTTDTTTSVTSSSNPSLLGQAVTFTAQVSPAPTGGTVAFDANGIDIAGCTAQSLDGSGRATCTISALTQGSHTITAFYSGDTNYNASDNTAAPLTQTVNRLSTVTFDGNFGSGTMSPQTASVPTALTTNAFSRSGYIFAGWDTNPGGGGTHYNGGATYGFAADITLYAQWTADLHHVTYAASGGSGSVPIQGDVATDDTFTVAANSLTRPGYTFAGWNDGATTYLPGRTYTMGPGDVTLSAKWIANLHHVTYAANGGSGSVPTQADVATDDTFTVAANSLARPGYTFAGWNDGATTYLPGNTYTMGTGDVTLTAKWTDTTAPVVTSILRQNPLASPTNATSVNFRVIFSEDIQNVTLADFSLAASGTAAGTLNAIIVQSASVYDVVITGVGGTGTLGLGFSALNDIQDLIGNPLGATPSIGTQENYNIDNTAIIVINGGVAGNPGSLGILNAGAYTVHFTSIQVTFNADAADPAGNTSTDDVTNPLNYLLLQAGSNGAYDTTSCAAFATNGSLPLVDDIRIPAGPVTYDNHRGAGPFTASVTVNNGIPLPAGEYRLLVCGTTSITDLAGNPLGGGVDTVLNFRIFDPAAMPATGFAPGVVTKLPDLMKSQTYANIGDLWLEIPSLGVQMPIVGVPLANGTWDVSWLGRNAGWLAGSAYPSANGNSVLTGHVYDAYGNPGPFARLNRLWWGDRIIVHIDGQQYIYEVREVTQVGPDDATAMLQHKEQPWLTLVTCRGYDEASNSYKYRILIRAVLMDVK